MYIISNHQLELLEKEKRMALVEKFLPKFKELKPTFLPATDDLIRSYIYERIHESKQWNLENDALIERYIYLCLSYSKMNEKILPKSYITLLTWPARSGENKLKYLHDLLIQDHYVIKSS